MGSKEKEELKGKLIQRFCLLVRSSLVGTPVLKT